MRNLTAGQRVVGDIIAATGNPEVRAAYLDLSGQASVKAFVANNWQGPPHLLINNAGIMALPELTRTPEGWEMQFATNFLGHFALTVGLQRPTWSAAGWQEAAQKAFTRHARRYGGAP